MDGWNQKLKSMFQYIFGTESEELQSPHLYTVQFSISQFQYSCIMKYNKEKCCHKNIK